MTAAQKGGPIKSAHLDLRIDPDLLDRVDAWRNVQPIPPARAAAVAFMLEGWLNDHGTYKPAHVAERPLRPRPRR